ncbi:uncharacterized protein [Centruroides vittatus]|uniref:uncharacterized protein n=1 Tax=Centruroides vittatus TaxID=120091 RepID=UPI00350FBD5B
MASTIYAAIFSLLIYFLAVEGYEYNYCDEDSQRKIEYSNVTFTPYPIESTKSLLASAYWNFLAPITCDAIFFITVVKCGNGRDSADKTFSFSMKFVFQTIRECSIEKDAYYACLEKDYAKRMQNGNSIQPGRMYVCAKLPKMFSPGCYDGYVEIRQKKSKKETIVLSCFQFTNAIVV